LGSLLPVARPSKEAKSQIVSSSIYSSRGVRGGRGRGRGGISPREALAEQRLSPLLLLLAKNTRGINMSEICALPSCAALALASYLVQ